MSNHAIEPWKVKDRGPEFMSDILDATGALVAVAANEDARRIVACVNACQGYTTERLETIVNEGESLFIRFNRLQERLERLEEHWTTHDNPKH